MAAEALATFTLGVVVVAALTVVTPAGLVPGVGDCWVLGTTIGTDCVVKTDLAMVVTGVDVSTLARVVTMDGGDVNFTVAMDGMVGVCIIVVTVALDGDGLVINGLAIDKVLIGDSRLATVLFVTAVVTVGKVVDTGREATAIVGAPVVPVLTIEPNRLDCPCSADNILNPPAVMEVEDCCAGTMILAGVPGPPVCPILTVATPAGELTSTVDPGVDAETTDVDGRIVNWVLGDVSVGTGLVIASAGWVAGVAVVVGGGIVNNCRRPSGNRIIC